MAEGKIREIIDFFASQLQRQGLRISKIILFGSQAEGSDAPDSDIDIAVVSEDFSDKNSSQRAELLNRADALAIKKFMVPLDVVMMSPEDFAKESSIIAAYVRQGKVMFEQN
jgi:predicted nucleotidyltransferase